VYQVSSYDRFEIYNALKQYGPVSLSVSADHYFSYYNGIISNDDGDIDHQVTIVGYDANFDAWIIKNSWGTGFGYGGFGYLDVNHPSGANSQGNNGVYCSVL